MEEIKRGRREGRKKKEKEKIKEDKGREGKKGKERRGEERRKKEKPGRIRAFLLDEMLTFQILLFLKGQKSNL